MPRNEDLVELRFHGTLDDGAVFDTSRGRSPRFFVIGRGQLIPAFEQALLTMSPGETRTIRLEPDAAYGPHDPALVLRAPRAEVAADARVGDEVNLVGGRPARIVALDADMITLDANHQLVGLALNFEVELVSVRPTAHTE